MSRILVIDHGLNLELARLLARVGHKVAYHCTTQEHLSLFEASQVGTGLEQEGFYKANNYHKIIDSVDQICFFSTNGGEEADWLKKKGCKVWGPSEEAESLESDRWKAKRLEEKAGLPLGPAERVTGVPALINYLQDPKNKDVFVKCSGFREIETFKHTDWAATQEQFIAPLLCKYGTSPTLVFILEPPIEPAIESGCDNIVLNGQFTKLVSYGYEDKDLSYIARLDSSELPGALQTVNYSLLPFFRGCSTFFSTEVRVTPAKKGYPIDLTIRAAHPPISGLMEVITNMASVITSIASNTLVEPKKGADFMAILVGSSDWGINHRLEVEFPEAIRNQVKLSKMWKKNGKYFLVPTKAFHVQCVGIGNSAKEACDAATHVAKQVKGKELAFDFNSFNKLLNETIPIGKKYGINF